MKTLRTLILALFLLSTVVCGLSAAYAAVPHLINYQGRLTDKNGKPLEGVYDITLKIYNAESGAGTMAPWEEKHSGITIQKGVFSILIGSSTPLDSLAFDQSYFLEIKVCDTASGTCDLMSPRQRITSTAYAMRAEKADMIKGTENIFLSSGNAGIGTTNPLAKLEVAGEGTLRLAPRSSMPSSPQEGTVFYHANDKMLYIYTSSGWRTLATVSCKANYPDEKIYGCGGGCNLGTQVHYTWQNINVPFSMNSLRAKYEWYSSNTGYDYYRHNIQVLVNGNAVESFMTQETDWTQRDNTYNVARYLRHDGTDAVRIQLTDTSANEEDNYGFRNIYFEFQ